MVFLIAGPSHVGKTLAAQRLMEKFHYPYLSIDHLKMGLIRSGQTSLTPMSGDRELTEYLWPIVREIIKTAVENRQDLIVEGCYIPYDWKKDFGAEYLPSIRYRCLVMSEGYVRGHYQDIKKYAHVIERRVDDSGCTLESLLRDNREALEECRRQGAEHILIEDAYPAELGF